MKNFFNIIIKKYPGISCQCFFVLVCVCFLMAPECVQAQKPAANRKAEPLATARLRIQRTDITRGYTEYTGKVMAYRRQGVELVTADGKKETIKPERILALDYEKTFQNTAADMLYEKKEYREALRAYREALEEERQPLAGFFILQRLVMCHRMLGNRWEAAVEFLRMAEAEAEMPDDAFACIPLAWKPDRGDSVAAAKLAELGKTHRTPIVQLLTASYMLSTVDRGQGTLMLKTLAKHKDIRIATLAETQLWRVEERKNIQEETLEGWEQVLARIPRKLCGGPAYVLAEKYAQLEKYDEAALGFLKAATVYPMTDEFSAEAMTQAARVMERAGQPEDAEAIFKEMQRKFPGTEAAKRKSG